MPKYLVPGVVAGFAMLLPMKSAAHILESFTISTQNVEVWKLTETSMQLRSDTNSYMIKLIPNIEGKVIFSLSGIGYRTSVKFSNLLFGVRITGYQKEEKVYPTFSVDDINRDIKIDQNRLIFQRIYGSLPVWFDTQVDSILLQFSNSYAVDIDQYLGIQDLKILSPQHMIPNPCVESCRSNRVMIALDGSSSIDKDERALIGTQLLQFIRKSEVARDSHQFCIVEFGTDVLSVAETLYRRELIDAFQRYKRDKNDKSKFTSWTNWPAVFDEALRRKPDLLIFITDGWSNWSDGRPSSFSAQYENLVSKSNQLKANGTRLLFVTSEIDAQQNSRMILSGLLNSDDTYELEDKMLSPETYLGDVDLITMQSFATMAKIDFASILTCKEEEKRNSDEKAKDAIVQWW